MQCRFFVFDFCISCSIACASNSLLDLHVEDRLSPGSPHGRHGLEPGAFIDGMDIGKENRLEAHRTHTFLHLLAHL